MSEPTENGATPIPPPKRGLLVSARPCAFHVEGGMAQSVSGQAVRMVKLRLETEIGSLEFIWPAENASQIAQSLLKCATGIEIARGTPPPGT